MRVRISGGAALLVCAVLVDAVLAMVRTGAATAPLCTLCVVAGTAVVAGPSAGMTAGFAAGVVLDLLAGPASPGGAHMLVGLALGALAGSLRPRNLGPAGAGVATGVPGVTAGAVATLALQGVLVPVASSTVLTVACAAFAAALACPMVVRLLRRPLSQPFRTT